MPPRKSGKSKSASSNAKAGTKAKASTTSSGHGTAAFVFADPKASPDDFGSFSKAALAADTSIQADAVIEKIPPPRINPPVMSLSDVLSASALSAYTERITFHCVGDTGGIKTPSPQFLVADKMVEDFADPDPSVRPAFFFHLGDVVYYFGQAQYYYDQFYDPYRDYPAPIFAIPGNHDAVVYKAETGNSLDAFRAQFCAAAPVHTNEAVGIARTAMTQPERIFHIERTFRKNHRPLFQHVGRHRAGCNRR